jgi:ribonuclease R
MREFPSSQEILRVFEARPEKTFRLRELVEELGLRSSQARPLKSALKDLSKRRKIAYLKKNHFVLARREALARHSSHPTALAHRTAHTFTPSHQERGNTPQRAGEEMGDGMGLRGMAAGQARGTKAKTNVIMGRLMGHRDGYGFVVPSQRLPETDQDIFIPPDAMKDAMHGDRVEVQIFRSQTRGRTGWRPRLEGVILRVTERAQKTVVGEFHAGPHYNFVVPFDRHISREIVIPRGEERPESHAGRSKRNRQFGGESEARARSHIAQVEAASAASASSAVRDLDGLIVDVEITRFPTRTSPPRGRVIEILGERDEFGVDVEIMIRKFHLPHRFPSEVLEQAETAPQFIAEHERQGREDFRSLPIVTIDGETAKDFDDAVYVERGLEGRYLLQVHIADVAHYVRPGTALDQEARLRGTSVYFPDRAVPMLPLELSNGICSLNPRVERLVMSALMEIDAQGRLLEVRLAPGVIHSAERMTYTAVHAVLTGEEPATRRYRSLVSEFKLMEELAGVLNRRREARGSIDFDLPEPEIEFDDQGQMIGVLRSERNIAHRIIEEFMLAANEAVATYLEQRNIGSLYRVHEKPDPKKVIEFEEIASTFGYSLGIELPAMRRVRLRGRDERDRYPRFQEFAIPENFEITSRHYQRLTQRIAGKPEERIISYLMLRSLKQARYSEENDGHFALASPTYTHFTSPIRRYPDLIVHRILKAALAHEGGSAQLQLLGPRHGAPIARLRHHVKPGAMAEGGLAGGAFIDPEELHALGIETSEAERRAADAERELMDWKKVVFMSSRLGDEFDALVISLTKHGFFIELVDLFVEGFVPIESFDDPRWIYRERLRALVHPESNRAYRLGDRVTARLDRIDRAGNKLLFSVVE